MLCLIRQGHIPGPEIKATSTERPSPRAFLQSSTNGAERSMSIDWIQFLYSQESAVDSVRGGLFLHLCYTSGESTVSGLT